MNKLKGKLFFKKFHGKKTPLNFFTGINIIYGESGVGKSLILDSIQKNKTLKSLNFEVEYDSNEFKSYTVYQNPDNQLLATTVSSELTFSGECAQKGPEELKNILDNGLKYLPDYIDPKMNPGHLSGGEKEQLNLIAALEFNPDILLIDDSLSFLSHKNKIKYVKILNEWVKKSSGIIIWVTSEYSDIQFGDYSWILSLSKIISCNSYLPKQYEMVDIHPGQLNCDINELGFNYQNSRSIFSKITIKIENVRSLGLYGENGSGKTTFAGLCFGDLKPTQGSMDIYLNGINDIRIGYLDQFPDHLIQLRTVNEFYSELILNQVFDLSLEKTFKKRLSSVGMKWNYVKNKRATELPWEMLRLLLIILLCHCKFDVLILDEPTFGLGWEQRLRLCSFLRMCMTRMHFMIISHELDFVHSICDQIIYFNRNNLEHAFVRNRQDA